MKGKENRIGPESCSESREGPVEALTREIAGQPLSFERNYTDADRVFKSGRQHKWGKHCRSARLVLRSLRPWHVRTLQAREPGALQ